MDRWNDKVAIVTGVSAGIGVATTKRLVKHGVIVVGVARRIEKVLELQKELENTPGKLHAFQADVSKEEDIEKLFSWVKQNLKTVHILINNAGSMVAGTLIGGNPDDWKNTINLNVLGLSICTKKAVLLMKDTGVDDGHIIHINSMAGHRIPPYENPQFNVYPASKYAVTALTETLRQELRFLKTKTKVTSISPGYTKTEFAAHATANTDKASDTFWQAIINRPSLTADDVAETVLFALSTPPHVQIHEVMLTGI